MACKTPDVLQHAPLCSITQGLGLQHTDAGLSCCIALPSRSSLLRLRIAWQQDRSTLQGRNDQRPSRQPLCQTVQQLRDYTSAFHSDASHFFLQDSELGRRKALLLSAPHPVPAPSHLTGCRNPPTFHHMEQSCSPAREIFLLFSP